MEQTLVIVKPDGVQRGFIGEIITRFERRGLRIVALRMLQMSRAMAEKHYAVHKGKHFYDQLVDYITSGPVVAAVVEGPDVINIVRKMIGKTRPAEADPGTIRGDLAVTGLRNLIHASDAPDTARQEISLFFDSGEILSYQRDIDKWIYED